MIRSRKAERGARNAAPVERVVMASCTMYTPGEPLIVMVSEEMIDAGLSELTRGRALGVPERDTLGYVYRAMHQKAPADDGDDEYYYPGQDDDERY